MSTQNPLIVFSGSETRAAELSAYASERAWLVMHEPDMLQTLGQVVFLYPDIVIIEDSDEELARTVFMHLNSVNIEPVLILSDHADEWNIPEGANVFILPRDTHVAEIGETVLAMVYGELMPV